MFTALTPAPCSDDVSSDGSGSIDREEFLQIPQIASNPLASRMIAIFDEEYVPFPFSESGDLPRIINPTILFVDMLHVSGGGTVDFQEFVGGLSAFSSRGGRDEKLRCTLSFHSLGLWPHSIKSHSRYTTSTGMGSSRMASFFWC